MIASQPYGPSHAEPAADLTLGKEVFTQLAEPHCSICHALADAGAVGKVGPNLNELKPTAERVKNAVLNGIGVMPSFADALTPAQIDAVAAYVRTATR